MKRLLVLIVLLAGCFLTSGCATLVENPQARKRRLSQITELQMKMLVEDWDYFWLYERNAGTTQWHPWVGL